jgi:hypothetical protein
MEPHAFVKGTRSKKPSSGAYGELAVRCYTRYSMDCDERTKLLEHCASAMHALYEGFNQVARTFKKAEYPRIPGLSNRP